jgi:hypothetical protein
MCSFSYELNPLPYEELEKNLIEKATKIQIQMGVQI